LSGDAEGTLRLWDSATWTQLGAASGSGPAVVTAAYSPDGSRVLTAHGDNGVRVWDATGLKLLSVTVPAPIPANYYSSAFPAYFSADGRNIVTYNTMEYESIEYRLWSVN
jgi:WD40 repeat protein